MWVCSFSGEVKCECVDSNQEWSPLSNYAKNKSAESMFPPEVYADWARVHIFLHAALHEEDERHAANPPWLWMGWSVYLTPCKSCRYPSSVSWSSEASAVYPCDPINSPGAEWPGPTGKPNSPQGAVYWLTFRYCSMSWRCFLETNST